jgi:hypothetical protein
LFPVAAVVGYCALPLRTQNFVLGLLAGKSKRIAARDAGYSEKHADTAAQKLVNSGKVRAVLAQAWAKAGATPERFISRIEERASRYHEALKTLPEGSPEWRLMAKLARDEDALLASIHGRLNINLKMSGGVSHRWEDSMVPPELRAMYCAKMREASHGRN